MKTKMVQCSCGKAIDKIPNWMSGIQVQFVCNNCPNRQLKNIAMVSLEAVIGPAAKPAAAEEMELVEAEAENDDE